MSPHIVCYGHEYPIKNEIYFNNQIDIKKILTYI